MKINGKILFFVKDEYNCIHFYKKKSKSPTEIKEFKNYVNILKKKLGERLIKAYILDQDEQKYIWCSSLWRTDLNEKISPNHLKYINYLAENRNEIKFIGPYKSMKTKGLHLCIYGHEWLVKPNQVQKGEYCPFCQKKITESSGSQYITKILKDNRIEFIKELSLKRFGYDRDLRLDFLVCQNNYPLFSIEYNGIQHYKTLRTAHFGGPNGSKKRKENDRIKRKFCWDLGIPIIDIPYTENEEQIEETVLYFLNLFDLIS